MAADAPITDEELAAALRVLSRVAADRAVLSAVSRENREALQRVAGEVARPDLKQRKKLQKELARKEQQDKKARDTRLRDDTGIRALRKAAVFPTPLPALPPPGVDAASWRPPAPEPAASVDDRDEDGAPDEELSRARKCYVCKRAYRKLHPFYDQLCEACGALNFAKRTATADLRGRTALVTGARVKIGYQAAILLLRAGCSVVVCTRFARDAARRYAREADFSQWRDRLHVYGVDLRHTPSVDRFALHLDKSLPRLDFQIHNACQTVRRPPGFYEHLLDAEHAPLTDVPPDERKLLEPYEEMRHTAPLGAKSPALLSQATSDADLLLGAAGQDGAAIFPKGALDQDLQQIDLRAHNSWRLTLGEVPTLELLEVLLVNAAAPFVLAAKLRGLMERSRPAPVGTATSHDDARHIVMVSAMEGQFYREHKTDKHPHTNMAKAALNMIVRTSAQDLARERIFMNAVDTGWVTDEDPAHLAEKKAEEHAFSPPLDIVDGAARIVDPILAGFTSGEHRHGLFFKDYVAVPW